MNTPTGPSADVLEIDVAHIEELMRKYGEVSSNAIAIGISQEAVDFIKKNEAIIKNTIGYLQSINKGQAALQAKIKQYEMLIEDFNEFIYEHDFIDLHERKFASWLIALVFPWLSSSLGKLVYDMHTIGMKLKNLDKN